MRWAAILGITVIVVLMAMYEWPKMNQHLKKEKVAFAAILIIGWLLAILLVFYPDMPGPTQMVDAIYKPLGKLLEK
ncbi:hypothetical protein Back11_04680 [Paenibacillus baekrokdamisoli]|uniref:Uncharacterized protein n=1 Tax=Paenibacillus baekrokdamisoli TaxID=1712516 RepID=A0A3G9J335_9BACL|nr:hypothetical protein [Paenibacillus baekrokdamisoli]MBB3067692.1 multisubunit Na+/H+ antiporter MnhB subunit [Paenibacillus baekrokdamisoli]BBH19123.1 hypothetical protein Back11_04680 [Paenibacillus baekrokdamisoli]